MSELIALSWSGGKDSALALHELRRRGSPPSMLLTTFDEASRTVPHHGVAIEMLEAQALAAGLPLVTVALPPAASNVSYEQRLRRAFATAPLNAATAAAFGDLFLEDLRRYRETKMEQAGLSALFPLWQQETSTLARAFIDAGFRAMLVSVDSEQLDPGLVGREYDHDLLAELPAGVDPCGENGEFHTFVYDGPIFDHPVAVRPAGLTGGGRFTWLSLA